MILTYYFDNVRCVELAKDQYDAISPRYTERYRDIEYEYKVNVSARDVEDYFDIKANLDDLFDFIDLKSLEEDENFISYMEDKYENDAYNECVERYGNE